MSTEESTSSSPNKILTKNSEDVGEPTKVVEMTNPKNNASAAASFKLMLLVLMVLQNSSTVLVGRHTRSNVPTEDLYVVNHLIFVSECGKFLLACILEYVATNGGLWTSLKENIFDKPLDAMKILVPALLYLVQNSLLYTALSNLSAPLFQVTYQGKLVTTALVSVLMLQRKYNFRQWVCLVLLSFGVAVVVLGEKKGDDKEEQKDDIPAQSLTLGLTAVTIACMSSALAGVYFEKVLKKPDNTGAAPVSLWMRNVQLAFFSIIIAYLQNVYKSWGVEASDDPKPYLHGFTFWVWVLVALQAGGGMLVAAVIKYADNVLKGLATGVSVVVATACSMVLFGTPLTSQFSFGAILILVAVYFFSNNLPVACQKAVTEKKEDDLERGDDKELKPLVGK